jgi:hypothetical protein
MIKKQRATDKWYLKYSTAIHVLTGIFIGRMSIKFLPEGYFLKILGEGWTEFLSSVEVLGGLPVIGSFILLLYNIYDRHKKQKKS